MAENEGQDRVTAVLDRYRALEEEVFAEMLADEQRALQKITEGKDSGAK
jgi:hypothetical protein